MQMARLVGYHLRCQNTLRYADFAEEKENKRVSNKEFAQCHEVNERHRSEIKQDTQKSQQTSNSSSQSLLASRVDEPFITEHHVPDSYSF